MKLPGRRRRREQREREILRSIERAVRRLYGDEHIHVVVIRER